jgi:hypothetical protein
VRDLSSVCAYYAHVPVVVLAPHVLLPDGLLRRARGGKDVHDGADKEGVSEKGIEIEHKKDPEPRSN